MRAQSITPAASTVYDLARALRDALYMARPAADFDGAGAGALCFFITARAALALGSACRRAALKRDPRTPRMKAADRARMNLAVGARAVRAGAAVLVSSATRPGVVHRVEAGRCTCEAVGHCWHIEAARTAPAPRPFRVARILAARRLVAV